MNNSRKEIRIAVEDLPELDTAVAVSGTSHQQDISGGWCLGIAAGIALYMGAGGR